jgi:hypothetical protein
LLASPFSVAVRQSPTKCLSAALQTTQLTVISGSGYPSSAAACPSRKAPSPRGELGDETRDEGSSSSTEQRQSQLTSSPSLRSVRIHSSIALSTAVHTSCSTASPFSFFAAAPFATISGAREPYSSQSRRRYGKSRDRRSCEPPVARGLAPLLISGGNGAGGVLVPDGTPLNRRILRPHPDTRPPSSANDQPP